MILSSKRRNCEPARVVGEDPIVDLKHRIAGICEGTVESRSHEGTLIIVVDSCEGHEGDAGAQWVTDNMPAVRDTVSVRS